MRKSPSLKLLSLILTLIFSFHLINAKENDSSSILAVEAYVNADKVYDGQSFSLRVKLYSTNPKIRYANLKEAIELGENLHKLNIRDVRRASAWAEDSYNGVKCYSTVIFDTPLLAVKTGKVVIDPIKFNIGVIKTNIVNDFFWGPIEKNSVENVTLSTNKVSFNINNLPSSKKGFSGAIGDFTLSAILPPGKIVADQELIVIYRLSGTGSLESAIFPDIKNILPEGLKFRSESIADSNSLIEGNVNSTLDVELTLYASKNGEFTIPSVEMVVFNPKSGKFQTIKSEPLTINVGTGRNSSKSSQKVYQI